MLSVIDELQERGQKSLAWLNRYSQGWLLILLGSLRDVLSFQSSLYAAATAYFTLFSVFPLILLIGLLALLSLAGYAYLALWFPLRPNYRFAPSPDIRSLAPSLREAAEYAFLLFALYALYLLTFKLISRREIVLPLGTILGVAAVFCLPLLLTFPVNATDVYRYYIRGRISMVHRQNPFSVPVSELNEEPYLPLAGEWATETSPYGPLWELSAAGASAIAANKLWAGLLIFKALAALTHLAIAGLIWLCLAKTEPSRRAGLTLLWAWNPALLLIFAMDGHNDGLMLVWLLLGWWFMARRRTQLGMIIMLLAPLTKPIGLLALPYFFLAGWRQLPDRRSHLRFSFLTGLAGLSLIWLSFLPFGSPMGLATRLLGEAGSGGGFSPLALIFLEFRERAIHLAITPILRMATALFLLLALWLLYLTWRGRSSLRVAADIFAGYIVQAFRFRIWYAAWPFPWLLLDRGRSPESDNPSQARLAAGLTFLLTSQLSVLIYGQIRSELLDESHLRAHRAGILFTFLLPILAGLVVTTYNALSRARQSLENE